MRVEWPATSKPRKGRIEWLPGTDETTNFVEQIGRFPREATSDDAKVSQSLE